MANKTKEAKRMEDSIGVGAIGKVRVLMMQELENAEVKFQSVSFKRKPAPTVPVSVRCGVPRKRQQPNRSSSNSAHTSCSSSSNNNPSHRRSGSLHRKVHQTRHTSQRVPMLGSEDMSIDSTPSRGTPGKKISQIVEIVDIKCGNPDRAWSDPITNQLRRLSFSRLSD